MSVSSQPDHFFQTTTSLNEINRKSRKSANTSGNLIKLPSKLLAVAPDPAHHAAVYVAESAGTVKRVALDHPQVTNTYRGPTAPMTSICFGLDGTIYGGCWDKSIWKWPAEQSNPTGKHYKAHVDFVKCLLSVQVGQRNLIISGGAEGDIIIWDSTGTRLHTIRGQSGAIQDLALDPFSEPASAVVFVATSERDIVHFTLSSSESLAFGSSALSEPIIAHETSVYKLFFDSDGDLWTASADKTAKHLVRENGWKADTTLEHPDFVRDIVVYERGGWAITACRDEEVRIWNVATGDLYHTFSGHYEEVTGLCLLGDLVVSVSIDATVRQWSLKPADLALAREEAANPKASDGAEEVKAHPEASLTEDEERELRELMDNEERELQDLMAEDLQ